MWEDFKIGDFDKGNTSLVVKKGFNISQNKTSYWWSNDYISGTIGKDTEEGKKITEMLESEDMKLIDDYIFEIGIKNIKPIHMLKVIENIKNESFIDGRRFQAKKIREALEY